MRRGFATLIGIVISLAILAFIMIKVLSSTLDSRQNLNRTANPKEIQKQVDSYQNQLQQKQNRDLDTDIK